MQYTDIFFFNPDKSSDNVYTMEYTNQLNKNPFGQNTSIVCKEEFIVYIYKNMYLSIQEGKNNIKMCQRIETNNYLIEGNKILVNIKITDIPLDTFPLIKDYHSIVNRKIIKYNNNISIIEDTIKGSSVSFLRVENDIENANKLVSQIFLG